MHGVNTGRNLDGASRMRPALAIVTLLVASPAFSESEGEHRQHGAHEHGHGTLDIVVEGEDLVVELRIPAVNVVGFEHAPRNDSERDAVRQALVPFRDAASVLVPSAEAKCEIEKVEAGIAGWDQKENGHRDAEERHENERRGHEDDEHDAHAREEHASEFDAEAHSELHAAYHFRCHAPERLTRIDAGLFDHLQDAEEIDIRVVTATAQMARELHPGETVVGLAP